MDARQTISTGLHHAELTVDQDKPKTLGSGFVTSVLGEGGAAVVYEIWNPKLEIHRAVKLWRPNLSEKDLQRFETEIKITSKLDHPNIVEIHTVGEWNGLPYIEMERIEGISLQQLVKTSGALPPVIALAIMTFICRALVYAHQEEFSLYGRKRKGVIHCDIKPANIMITKSGIVKLMDFGIANPTNVSLHTDPDKVTGSLQYMAPEQIRSRQVDARTDIYSIGVVLYEILSGTRAFPSKQLLDVIEKRKTNDYVALQQVCGNLPKSMYRLVATCMDQQPENRYQNVSELLKNLTSLYRKLSHEDTQEVIQHFIASGSVPQRKIRITRQTAIPVIAAVVPTLVLVATIMFFVFKSHRPADDPVVTSLRQEAAQSPPPAAPALPAGTAGKAGKAPAETTPVSAAVNSPTGNSTPAPVPKKSPQVAAALDPLSALQALVDGGNLSVALKRLAAKPIEDGAYYALYARCLYESGEWGKASEMAEKSLRVPSKHIEQRSREGQYLLYKAKYLSARYDASPSRDAAKAAIAAWWEVRGHFDGTPESAKASFADSEIGRISTILNE